MSHNTIHPPVERNYTSEQLHALAQQFRCPNGEQGLKTGEKMFLANRQITEKSISLLQPNNAEVIMEIGCGIARQTEFLLEQFSGLHYIGVEMSPIMLTEAQRINEQAIRAGNASFVLSNGKQIPLPNGSCQKIFTVNTLYFWENPQEYLFEIYRVLANRGVFCLTFAEKTFMQQLPFSHCGFSLYHSFEAEALFQQTPFQIREIHKETEPHVSHVDGFADREVVFIIAEKNE